MAKNVMRAGHGSAAKAFLGIARSKTQSPWLARVTKGMKTIYKDGEQKLRRSHNGMRLVHKRRARKLSFLLSSGAVAAWPRHISEWRSDSERL